MQISHGSNQESQGPPIDPPVDLEEICSTCLLQPFSYVVEYTLNYLHVLYTFMHYAISVCGNGHQLC